MKVEKIERKLKVIVGEAASLIHKLGAMTPEEVEIIAWAMGEEIRHACLKSKGGGLMGA